MALARAFVFRLDYFCGLFPFDIIFLAITLCCTFRRISLLQVRGNSKHIRSFICRDRLIFYRALHSSSSSSSIFIFK